MRWRAAIITIIAALLTPADTAAAQQEAPPAVRWAACGSETGVEDPAAECASVALPIRPGASRTVEIAVGRITRAGAAAGRTQLWFLAGGPGDSGIEALGRLAEVFAGVDVDLYTLDHRGVGGSAALRCPEQEAEDSSEGREIAAEEWQACRDWLRATRGDLEVLTTRNAAEDLGALINRLRRPGDRIVVFGASYGTYWANTYLHLFPEQPDAVILDGIVPPDWTFAEFDEQLDQTARRVIELCIRSGECASHLGPDPVSLAAGLPDRLEAGHCPDLQLDGHTARLLLGNMLMAGADVRPYITAMVYRINRCRIRDLEAIGALFTNLFDSGDAGVEAPTHSPVLQRHVAMSELWPADAPDPEVFERAGARAVATTAVSQSFAATFADWPRYAPPAFAHEPAPYRGPLLMLHGGLDPTMAVERLDGLRAHFSGTAQHFVLFPEGAHVVLNEGACARTIYADFLRDPWTAPDTTCIDDLPAVRLDAPSDDDRLFGTADFWGEHATGLELGMTTLSVLLGILIAVAALTIGRWLRRRLRGDDEE